MMFIPVTHLRVWSDRKVLESKDGDLMKGQRRASAAQKATTIPNTKHVERSEGGSHRVVSDEGVQARETRGFS